MDTTTAYRIQKAYNRLRLRGDRVAGFKAGLTTEGVQKRFGVNEPVAGVLFASGKKTGSPRIDSASFHKLVIETEVGFVIGKPITRKPKDEEELRAKIRAVMPVIELPEVGFADMRKLQGVDIIAGNVGAVQFIVGKERKLAGIDPDRVRVTLTQEGQKANEGNGTEALGSQWKAALWLVRTMVEQGWKIRPGDVLFTGALGQMVPGEPGSYVADFGELGSISFEIR